MTSFVELTNYYKILKIASCVDSFKQQDMIYVLGVNGKVLSIYLEKLIDADYLFQSKQIGRMRFYSITKTGNEYLQVFEKIITHLKNINEETDITKTSYGDLTNPNDLVKIIKIVNRNNNDNNNKKKND